jgi:hypothetical protein
MAKILNFGPRPSEKVIKPESIDDTTQKEVDEILAKVTDKTPGALDVKMLCTMIGEDLDKFRMMKKLVENMPTVSTDQYTKLLLSYTPTQIALLYKNSSTLSWNKKPALFKALILDIQRRIKEMESHLT